MAEGMLAFSLLTLFLVSALALSSTMHRLHYSAVQNLENLRGAVGEMDQFILNQTFASTTSFSQKVYGNNSYITEIYPLSIAVSDFDGGWGRENCDPRISFNSETAELFTQGVDLGSGNISTDIEVRNGFAYVTADSSTASAHDFYIIDIRNPASPLIISSLETGPGLSRLEVVGHYIYAANTGSTNQLQVIDIKDRTSPVLRIKVKLPTPNASSTPAGASSIFYHDETIYLGTHKWRGKEFSVFNVSEPISPSYSGGFETDTLVNDIYVRDGFAYLAASDEGQMRILDVHDLNNISQVEYFSPSGWETQEGKSLSYFEEKLSLGRTTGGFNNVSNPELFIFSSASPPVISFARDIPGGNYGSILQPDRVFVMTRFPNKEFQIWKPDLSAKLSEFSLGFFPQGLSCDHSSFYFATGDSRGVAALISK